MTSPPAQFVAAGALCAQNQPVSKCPDLRGLADNQSTVAVPVA